MLPISHSNADSVSLCSTDLNCDTFDESIRKPVIIDALCLVGNVAQMSEVKAAVKTLGLDILTSETGEENRGDANVGFVLAEFSGPDFNYLNAAGRRTFGPTAIIESAKYQKLPIRSKMNPIFCQSMKGIVCTVTGFKHKNLTSLLVDKIHYMGGSVRKSWTPQITHLIASTTQSEKYRLAISMGVPAMKKEWVEHCWEKRNVPHSSATNKQLESKFKLSAFHDLKISLHGMENDLHDIEQNASANGGELVSLSANSTHLIVDLVGDVPTLPSSRIHVVTVEWFWVSIQLGLCANESLYAVGNANANRKRPASPGSQKEARTSRRSQACKKRSLSDRSLDIGFDASSDIETLPEHMFSTEDIESLIQSPQKQTSKRRQCCVELLQTERNYVEVLKIIMNYKDGFEEEENKGDECTLLTKAEMQLVFGKVQPIYDLHQEICKELVNLIMHWNENRLIGAVWANCERVHKLEKCYPPFMNSYDQAKQTLVAADKQSPRLHAFLKARQSRPESQRQSLVDLLIRPVQRLPSVTLLLQEVLKRTDKSNPDHGNLLKALESIKGVLAYINEDKRKTEDRMMIFEIFNGIDNCPVEFVTAQRQFLARLDVIDLAGGFAKQKGQMLTLYLFNDALEVTKKRTVRASEELVHPPLTPSLHIDKHATVSKFSLARHKPHKTHKHIKLLALTSIRRVSDVIGYDSDLLLSLTVRQETSEDTWAFQAVQVTEDIKRHFLNNLCQQVINICGPSRSVGPVQFKDPSLPRADNLQPKTQTPTSKIIDEQFNKIFKHSRPGPRRLTRKLSFSQTPTNSLRRAVSTMTLRMSGTLQRMSRSNLRLTNINELPPSNYPSHSGQSTAKSLRSSVSSAISLPKSVAPTPI